MSEEDGAANTMEERADESTPKLYVLLEMDRLVATVALALAVFVTFIALVAVLGPPLIPQLTSGDAIETMFSTMIGAVVTATTLTVTIGQVVLSQENGPLGDQHQRMSNSMDVRSYVGEIIGKPSPADPSAFLRELVDACGRRAEDLRRSFADSQDDQLKADAEDLADSVIGNANTVTARLSGTSFGSFDTLSAALNFNYSRKIYEIERLQDQFDNELDDTQQEQLTELRTALSMFAPAREHVKTLYFQWELINLSRQILYLSVPALVVSGIMVAVVEPATFPNATVGIDNILWVVAGAFTFTLMPFLLLVAYILRVVTIAKRTLAIEPLILRNSDQ